MTTTRESDRHEWHKPTTLAEREGVSRRTIWRWVKDGKLEVQRKSARAGVRVRTTDESRAAE